MPLAEDLAAVLRGDAHAPLPGTRRTQCIFCNADTSAPPGEPGVCNVCWEAEEARDPRVVDDSPEFNAIEGEPPRYEDDDEREYYEVIEPEILADGYEFWEQMYGDG
jgi:hypothetical protein